MRSRRSPRLWQSLVLLGLAGVLLMGGCVLTSLDTGLVEDRLKVSGEVVGGEATFTAFAWRGFLNAGTPVLVVAFEITNVGSIPLELISVTTTLRDPLGRERAGEEVNLEGFYRGPVWQGEVLLPSDTRPNMSTVLMASLPQPLTWTEAKVKVVVRPARSDGLALYWRSNDITITSAGYRDGNRYVLAGRVNDFQPFAEQFRQQRRGALNVRVLASFYDADGKFVTYGSVPIAGGTEGDFVMTFSTSFAPREIASYKVWFAELTP